MRKASHARWLPAAAGAAALAVALLVAAAAPGQDTPTPPRGPETPVPVLQWEYATITAIRPDLAREINDRGRQGWELVAVVKDPTDRAYTGYLKRPTKWLR